LIQTLPSGTAYGIGVVLIVMMPGRLMQYKGSLARAVLPFVIHLKWGWHRVERAMERGKFQLDALFDRAFHWCSDPLEVEVVRLGELERAVISLDSSTMARLRCQVGKAELLGKLASCWPCRARQYGRRGRQYRLDSGRESGIGAARTVWREL
jgi:hypothetical protein